MLAHHEPVSPTARTFACSRSPSWWRHGEPSRLCPDRGDQRAILVHGIVFSHYSIQDSAAEAYAMVSLFESGYADQNDLARCFGCSTRTLHRHQQRLRAGGLTALARTGGRPPASSSLPTRIP